VGGVQAIALIPGFSRTGATITGSLMVGLSHKDSVRFSFLLATPIIAAAALLKLPDLVTSGDSRAILISIVGGLCAGISAYFSVKFLTKYFETNTLVPFAIYCFLAGGISFAVILLR
jgi:undecaprenyl-diphosphatase